MPLTCLNNANSNCRTRYCFTALLNQNLVLGKTLDSYDSFDLSDNSTGKFY